MRLAGCLLFCSFLAPAQSLETAALGGPCLPEARTGNEWYALVNQQGEAAKRGDREAALALMKQIVRSRCSNEYWWFHLAESLLDLGRPAEALTALDALYHRGNNSIDGQLQTAGSVLHELAVSEAFRASPLAANLAKDRNALAQRRKEVQARLAAAPQPPANYIAKAACPFECCRFGAWSVHEETALFDRPGGARQIARVSKGESVQALTGEVHLRPEPVRVRFGSPMEAPEGSIVYLLDNLGEGFAHVWVAGKVVEVEVIGVREQCTFAGPDCWGEFLTPGSETRQREASWWVQIKTRGGATGWTRETSHFGGMDGCG